MDQGQQALVRASFAKVAPISAQAAALFYDRLFTLDPGLRPLFRGDMKRQGEMLMAVLATAVGNLHRLDQILPAVRDLGRRHAGYGVKDSDYDTVAAALLSTLEMALGEDFTPPVRNAWAACYQALAGEMRAASRNERGAELVLC
jgi:hemoglobin-like flavoprotein